MEWRGTHTKGALPSGGSIPQTAGRGCKKETENRPLSLLKHGVLLRVQIVDLHVVVDCPPGAVGVGRHTDIMRAVV